MEMPNYFTGSPTVRIFNRTVGPIYFKTDGRVPPIYIYIYIYSHPQTFVVSQLFSVARLIGRLKLGLKPVQLYVRLSIIPLNQQANHTSSGLIWHYVVAFVCLHFCLTRYQSAQFIRGSKILMYLFDCLYCQ